MMKKNIILFAVVLALIIGYEILRRVLTNKQSDKLMKLFLEGNFKEFDKQIDSKLTRYLIPPFNQDYMKLNSYLARGDEKKIHEMFSRFDKVRLNAAQKELVYTNAFYYYVGLKDENKARKYYNLLMESTSDEDSRKEIDRMFDIYINNGYKYLEDTEKEYRNADEREKMKLQALLAVMYENKGDKKKAQEYYDRIAELEQKVVEKMQEEAQEND